MNVYRAHVPLTVSSRGLGRVPASRGARLCGVSRPTHMARGPYARVRVSFAPNQAPVAGHRTVCGGDQLTRIGGHGGGIRSR